MTESHDFTLNVDGFVRIQSESKNNVENNGKRIKNKMKLAKRKEDTSKTNSIKVG